MKEPIMVLLFGIALICGMFYLFGFRIGKNQREHQEVCHDYIIAFKQSENKSLLPIKILSEIGTWHDYGNGYRGGCTLTKEDLEKWISKKTHLSLSEFQVIPSFSGMNYIHL